MGLGSAPGADGGTLNCMGRLMTDRKDLPSGGYLVMPSYLPWVVVVALLGWTAGGIWWTSKLDSRVATLEEKALRAQQRVERQVTERDRLTIVEQQVIAIRENQDRTSAVLERIERRLGTWSPAP